MSGPDDEFSRRRKSRAIITALLLAGLVLLFYCITLVRIGMGG